MSGQYEVHGGEHGLEAQVDDLEATGGVIRTTGFDVTGIAGAAHKYLIDPNLLSSAPLAPGTFATFEAEMLAALDGPTGLSAHGLSMSAAGLFMQGMGKAYQATDEALEIADDVGDWAQGYTAPLQLAWMLSPTQLPGTLAEAQQIIEDPQQWLVEHPDAIEELVASTPGVVSLLNSLLPPAAQGLIGFPFTVEQGSSVLADLYNQELKSVTAAATYESEPPDDIEGALARLEEVAGSDDQFAIEEVDGTYNVYLPGTKEFDQPFDESGLVQNMGTNLAAVAGDDNAYQEAVLQALEGLPPGAKINLIGHSQGGIVATRLAEAIANGDTDVEASVASVLTAGSPVDHIDVPEDVPVVSLVNEYDIVPRLDGEPYGDKSNHTTIVFEQQNDSVTDNHSLGDVYVDEAGRIVNSDDEAVVDALDDLDFGDGDSSSVTDYEMERG